VIPRPIEYTAPATVAEVVRALADQDARPLAGGQGLLAAMQTGDVVAGTLVDLRRVPGLRGVRAEPDGLRIGAMTTLDELATDPVVRTRAPALAEAAGAVGDPQVRNRATIGGNLASSGTDLPAVALALDFRVLLATPDGEADLSFAEYVSVGPANTTCGLGDWSLAAEGYIATGAASGVITGVVVPTGGARSAFEKLPHRAVTSPVSAVGVELAMGGGTVEAVRIGLSGPPPRPVRLRRAEEALVGTDGGREAVAAAFAALPGALFAGVTGYSAEYLRHVTGVLASRAVRRIVGPDARPPAARDPGPNEVGRPVLPRPAASLDRGT
jgi:carbon-monoxide dehydrogenase medium subunit